MKVSLEKQIACVEELLTYKGFKRRLKGQSMGKSYREMCALQADLQTLARPGRQGAGGGGVKTVTFTAHPIETAPKDRAILLYYPTRKKWLNGIWEDQRYHKTPNPYWRTFTAFGVTSDRANEPTYWAEIADMEPVEGVVE